MACSWVALSAADSVASLVVEKDVLLAVQTADVRVVMLVVWMVDPMVVR